MKRIFAITALVLFVGLSAGLAHAADFIKSDEGNGNVLIRSTETHHNAYVGGSSVTINGPITGDLYGAGADITVAAPVEQDAVLAASHIVINQTVGGDARLAGAQISVNAEIKGDVLAAGSTVQLSDKATVGGDAILAGSSILVAAPVMGSLKATGASVTIDSKITGSVDVYARELTFGSNAEVAGKINFHGSKPATIKDGAKVDGAAIVFTQTQKRGHGLSKFWTIALLIKFLALMITLFIFNAIWRGRIQRISREMAARPWSSLGIGFVALIVIPVISIVLFATLVGFYLALFALLWYALILCLSVLLASAFLGSWIIKMLTKRPALVVDWQAIVIGVVVMLLVALIPIVGPIIYLALILIAFGTLVRGQWGSMKESMHNPES